jgi:hypothetical protein
VQLCTADGWNTSLSDKYFAVLLEMGEEKHAVSDTKWPLLLSGLKQNIYKSKNFRKTILFKISSTFFWLLSRCLTLLVLALHTVRTREVRVWFCENC